MFINCLTERFVKNVWIIYSVSSDDANYTKHTGHYKYTQIWIYEIHNVYHQGNMMMGNEILSRLLSTAQ